MGTTLLVLGLVVATLFVSIFVGLHVRHALERLLHRHGPLPLRWRISVGGGLIVVGLSLLWLVWHF